MSRGWSVRVIPKQQGGVPPPIEWYYVAEPDRDKAVAAVKARMSECNARVEAVKALPVILINGKELKAGEVTHVYRRRTRPSRVSPEPGRL